ncbi:MAG: hypothetical protein AAF502_04015 [Bacteroidota bacterium]
MITRLCLSSLILLLCFMQAAAQNVGIGTPLPDYTLDVNGNAGVNDFIYHNDDPNNDTRIGFPGNDTIAVEVGGVTVLRGDGVQGKLTVNALAESVNFSILSDSFEHLFYANPAQNAIGIGTASPQYLLDIAGDVRILSDSFEHMFLANTATGFVGIGTDSPGYLLDVDGDFRVISDGIEHLVYADAANGYVGIGTASPSHLLDVNGNFRVISDGIEHLLFVDAQNEKVGIGTDNPQFLLDVNGVLNANEIHVGGTPAFKKMQSGGYPQGQPFVGQTVQSYFIFFPESFSVTPNFVATFRTNPLTPNAIVNITVKGVTTSFAEILVYRIDSADITQGGIINWVAWE